MKPALIVVCGAPASGKTTLARRLADDLRLPLLEKDVIKESLAEAIPAPDRDASRRLGSASTKLLYDLAHAMLERGTSVMIECNFSRTFARDDLRRLAGMSQVLVVQCVADAETIERRYRDRHASGARHVAHFDLDALPDLIAGLEANAYDLTELGYPAIVVNTEGGYHPVYPDIVESIRRRRTERG